MNYRKLRISLIDNFVDEKLQLLPCSPSKEKLPAFNDQVTVVNTRKYKPLHANTLTNVITNSYASGFIKGDRLLLSETLHKNRYKIHTDGCSLFKYSTNYCVGSTKIDRSLENAQIGGSGSFNWYHFLIECLPKALLASKLPQNMSEATLVPNEYIRNTNYSAALSLLVNNKPLIPLDQSQNIFVKNLIVFDEVSECPYNYFSGFWPEANTLCNTIHYSRSTCAKLKAKYYMTLKVIPSINVYSLKEPIFRECIIKMN